MRETPATAHGARACVALPRAGLSGPDERLAEIKRLYAAGQWVKVICLAAPEADGPADLDYYRGMALAKLKRWREAEEALERGRQKAPRDKRVPAELAGIAFVEKRYSTAKKNLHRVLQLDPADPYANNFLATLFSLEDNLPAALPYWNRIGMPQIQSVRMTPPPSVDPVLLDRAFTFSPGGPLQARDFRATRDLIDSLGIFSQPRFELEPLAQGRFEANFIAHERNGPGGTKTGDILALLRGVPYETVYPEGFNLRHAAINFTSLLRWDPNKERVFASISSPLAGNPRWRYRLDLDGRREYWNLSNTFFAAASPVSDMQLEKIEGGGEIESIIPGRLRWSSGIDLSGRSFRNVDWSTPSAAGFFKNGFALEYRSGLDARLLTFPERRLTVDGSASAQTGKLFTSGTDPFAQAEAGIKAHWYPRAEGDDYEMTGQLRAGRSWGMVPFDDLFILGLERDNDLWLRAHIGTAAGKKGSAPLGRDYSLFNWDDSKSVYGNAFFTLKLGPFLDAGKITDPTRDFGSPQWLFDTGIELKVRALGRATVEFFFGRDLRTGRTTFYGTTAPF
jgi:tetratricopeptide (TPR) repeat protein